MATEKVIRIDTTQAQKNVEGLDKNVQQLGKDINKVDNTKVSGNFSGIDKNLKATSEGFKGLTNEVNKTAITIDQIAPNIAKIGAGIAGGFSIVSGAITLFGNDSEEAKKAVTQLQFYLQQLPLSFFAIAESITAVSSTIDTFKGPLKAFGKEISDTFNKAATSIAKTFYTKNAGKNVFSFLKESISPDVLKESLGLLKQFTSIVEADQEKVGKALTNLLKGTKLTAESLEGINEESFKFLTNFIGASSEVKSTFIAMTAGAAKTGKQMSNLANILTKVGVAFGGIFGAGLVVAITAAISAISAYNDKLKELNKTSEDLYNHTKELFDVNTKGLSDAQKQITIVETLVRNAKDETNTLKQRKDAIKQLNQLVPEYNATLSKEGKLYETNARAITDYVEELKRVAKAQAAIQLITEKYQTIIEKSAELQLAESIKAQVDAANEEYKNAVEVAQQSATYLRTGILVIDQEVKDRTSKILTDHNIEVANSVDTLKADIEQATKDIEYIYTTFDTNIELVTEKVGKSGAEVKNKIDKLYLKPLKDILTITDEMKDPSNGFDPWIKYFVQTITEAQKQIMILNDVMSRFGESSLGLGAQYANVVSDFSNMFDQMTRIILEKGEVGWGAYTQMASSGIQAVGTLLNALGDEQDTTNKEGFETQKKYQISASVMNMLAGILSAWTSAMTIPPPAGPILGAANSAMIGALGAVQIAKIKSQQFGGTASADTTNKEGFETQKKYQISASVMNMLAGILSAWTSAMTIPPPAGPILGAANSAMIGALGAVQIAKIKSQQFGGTASASSNAINSTIIPPVEFSRLITGANIEGSIKDTRQFVSVVEINSVQNKVRVSENEARY
nr:hypothetical protein ELOWGMBK_ELOWGMBK_CDS_0007 [Herelleviridae sp.]